VALGVTIAAVAVGTLLVALILGGNPSGPLRIGQAPSSAAPGVKAPPPVPGHEVYGFVPYWEIDDTIADHLRATDTTTVALFSVTHTSKGAIATTQTGYRRISGPIGSRIIADAHELGRRVDLTWTSFGRAKNDALFASVALQERVIAALVKVSGELRVDGIAVDVEAIGDSDIPAYGAFVGRLRTALLAADPKATITATTGAGPQGAALALAASLAGADRIFLMGYDYRTGSSDPGGSAPIARRDIAAHSLASSLALYELAGVPVDRTILGLPLYGLAWKTADSAVGSPKVGKGEVWVPRRNLAALRDPTTASYDAIEDVEYLAVPDGTTWRAVYYDSPRSLRPKLGLANAAGLAGAGFWALGYERGLPDYTALIAAFRAGRPMTAAADGAGPSPVIP
jgi:spore germination protein